MKSFPRNNRFLLAAGRLLILLATPGCSHLDARLGQPLPETEATLAAGMTSLGEALEHLGPPARLSASGDGLAMLYEYNRVEEFQIGFNFDQPGLEYIKLVSARGWLEHEAVLLFFDERGILRSIGREQWRQPLGSGGAAQILVALSSLVDSSRARRANPQHTWGAALLAPLPTTLNAHHGPHTGSSGLEQTLAPDKVGQRTLEMGASPALPERSRE